MTHNFVICLVVYDYKIITWEGLVACDLRVLYNLYYVWVANNFVESSMQNCVHRLTVLQT